MVTDSKNLITVYGLGHLGYVTAACLTFWGHSVIGVDSDLPDIPAEPDLRELINLYESQHELQFSNINDDCVSALSSTVWITIDTPINSAGYSNISALRHRIARVLLTAKPDTLVLISSQVPVGFASSLQELYPHLRIVSAPENLRRGQAIANFLRPSRIVIGCDDAISRSRIEHIYRHVQDRICWTTREGAEFSKHALNAYLGLSIAFANELAALAEHSNVDYREVASTLRLDPRIGSEAYVRAGTADARHFLRDMHYLQDIANTPLVANAVASLLA